jgi:hypothetical protein
VLIFPDQLINDDILVIVTVQKTENDLIAWGDEIELEKDACLERYFAWGNTIRNSLLSKARDEGKDGQIWFDLIDPPSGTLNLYCSVDNHAYRFSLG